MKHLTRPRILLLAVVGAVAAAVAAGALATRGEEARLCVPSGESSVPGTPRALLVFVVERAPLWRPERAAPGVCDALATRGIATLLVRIARSADPAAPRAAELAPRLKALLGQHPELHGGGRRIVLGGQAGAAEVIAHLALNDDLRVRAGLDSPGVAGVLALGGRFAGPPVPDAGSSAAPPPAFLVLVGDRDAPAAAREGRRFARAAERSGVSTTFLVIEGRDGESIADLTGTGELARGLTAFVRGDPAPADLDPRWIALGAAPAGAALTTESFAQGPSSVMQHAMSVPLRVVLQLALGSAAYELRAYDLATYRSVDLLEFLATQPPSEVGHGDHLVVTNLRGERTYYARAELERLRPRIVIGIDDESNLFRLLASYRPKRSYSWLEDKTPPEWMMRPVGGVLLFPGERPAPFPESLAVTTALTPASFRWERSDPLGPVRGLTGAVQDVLLGPSGCAYCHQVRGTGGASRHVVFGHPDRRGGGAALALEDYAPPVLHQFLFDQERAAATMGVRPLAVPPDSATRLEALVRGRQP